MARVRRSVSARLDAAKDRAFCGSGCALASSALIPIVPLGARYNLDMGHDPADLLRRALQLPEEARAALADSLWASLDHEVDEDAEEAWRQEIRRRLQEIDSGAVKLIPWEDVRRELLDRLER
jgi:putative addiction module component (TIGR02574 family)